MDRKLYSINMTRDVISYAILWYVCDDAWIEATKAIEGKYFKLITVMVFSAFTLEAYLNHIGRLYYPNWDEEEKKKSPIIKLRIITEKLGMSPDYGRRPFQTFKQIFSFRNKIAHGKTEYLRSHETKNRIPEERIQYPRSGWELRVSENQARIFMDDTNEMIKIIHNKAGFTSYHFDLGLSSWDATEVKQL